MSLLWRRGATGGWRGKRSRVTRLHSREPRRRSKPHLRLRRLIGSRRLSNPGSCRRSWRVGGACPRCRALETLDKRRHWPLPPRRSVFSRAIGPAIRGAPQSIILAPQNVACRLDARCDRGTWRGVAVNVNVTRAVPSTVPRRRPAQVYPMRRTCMGLTHLKNFGTWATPDSAQAPPGHLEPRRGGKWEMSCRCLLCVTPAPMTL